MLQAPKSYAAILAHVTHFLTIAIHTILAIRNVYPTESFLTARAYNYPVKQSRHPGVCAWINAAVSAVHAELLKGTVARAVVAIAHSESCTVLERYVFDLTKLPVVRREDWETPIVRGDAQTRDAVNGDQEDHRDDVDADPRGPGGAREHELADLTEQLRGTLAVISTCHQRLKPIPAGCTFTVAIELKNDADPPVGHPQPWIPVQPESQRDKTTLATRADDSTDSDLYGVSQTDSSPEKGKMPSDSGKKQVSTSNTVPVRAVDAGEVTLEVWVEEGKSKSTLTESDFGSSADSSSQATG